MPSVTHFQFINFVPLSEAGPGPGLTAEWSCKNNKSRDELGRVGWYSSWKQYVFYPTTQSIYSLGCLADIQSFLAELNYERKSK